MEAPRVAQPPPERSGPYNDRMRPCLIFLLVLTSAPALAAGLRSDEAALNEQLLRGVLPAREPASNARLSAARGAVALAQGRREDALRHFEAGSAEFASDCALRARLAELGQGGGCAELRPNRLDPALLEPPAVFLIVAAHDKEVGSAFPAAVLVTALKALAPAGGLSVESTADRFRITGNAALEGTWYLDDRLLLAARPAPGRGRSEAGEALAAFVELRPQQGAAVAPVQVLRDPPASGRSVEAHGVVLELPASWPAADGDDSWLAEGADPSEVFPPRAGAVAVSPRNDRAESTRRRNPMARRKKSDQPQPLELAALPAGAKLLDSHELSGSSGISALEWRSAAGGGARQALMRTLSIAGREVLVVAHLGEGLTTERALRLLDDVQAARP